MSIAQQRITDFAPGEQEAVMQAAQAVGHTMLAEKRAKRRWWKNCLIAGAVLTLWLACCCGGIKWLTHLLTGWNYASYYFETTPCAFLGVTVGVVLYYYNDSRRCRETGGWIQIKRLCLSKKIIAAIAVLIVGWMFLLGTFYVIKPDLGVSQRAMLSVVRVTEFVLALLGYLLTVFINQISWATRKQLLQEEKWTLEIFD